jgi:hypothetical protein
MGYVAVAAVALLLGLVAGFALRKRANEWCPTCGWPLTAGHCPNAAVAVTRPGRSECATSRTTS